MVAADKSESLATDERVDRACRSFAMRWGGMDWPNAAQEGRLAVLELERDRFAPTVGLAIVAARGRLLNLRRDQARDRARAMRHAEALRMRGRLDYELLDVPDLLAKLYPVERKVVHMRLWLGLTAAECAATLGVTVDAVNRNYARAIMRLRIAYCGGDTT